MAAKDAKDAIHREMEALAQVEKLVQVGPSLAFRLPFVSFKSTRLLQMGRIGRAAD